MPPQYFIIFEMAARRFYERIASVDDQIAIAGVGTASRKPACYAAAMPLLRTRDAGDRARDHPAIVVGVD